MGLQVWLPLNGNLNNLGLSDAIVTNSGTTVDNAGKIGKCYKTSSSGYINLGYTPNFNTTSLTISGWFRFNKDEIATVVNAGSYSSSATSPTGNIIGNDSYGGIGIIWTGNNVYSSGSFSSMNIFATLRTATVNNSTSSFSVPFDTWIHITLTWDVLARKLSIYKDGVIVGNSSTFNNFTDGISKVLTLNYRAVYGGNGPSFYIPFKVNDVRIYDECLSDKQVKEISKGLILHYKLDSFNYNTNLIKSLSAGGLTTVTNNKIVTSGVNADTYFYINVETPLILNKSYTISCIGDNFPEGTSFSFPIGSLQNTSKTFIIKLGYNEYTFTANDTIVNAGKKIILDDTARSAYTNKCEFSNFYLTANDAAKDCSGYNNNGTINGSIETSSDTIRHLNSTYFPTTTTANYIRCNNITVPTDVITMSCWFKSNVSGGGGYHVPMLISSTSSNSVCWYIDASSGTRLYATIGSSRIHIDIPISTFNILNGLWHHLCMVYDGLYMYSYGDAILLGKSSTYTGGITLSNNDVSIGIGYGDTRYNSNAYMSDSRIYATALSAEDIKELYQTTLSIDKNGNIYCYEFIEE